VIGVIDKKVAARQVPAKNFRFGSRGKLVTSAPIGCFSIPKLELATNGSEPGLEHGGLLLLPICGFRGNPEAASPSQAFA
jgi:hypothetical protein